MGDGARRARGTIRGISLVAALALATAVAGIARPHLRAGASEIEPVGCISATGTAGACGDGVGLAGATGVTTSPDGSAVYVASETDRAVAAFTRDPATGAIVQLAGTDACVSNDGTDGSCADGTALVGPRQIAVSPDGANLYFPASGSQSVAVFSRDASTGRLDQLPGLDGCVSESGTNGACADGVALAGARGVAVSPDGEHVYVAAFFADAIAVFSRDTGTGTLTQVAGPGACVSETGTGGACADGRALDGPRSVAVAPDGRHLYAVSEVSGAVAAFTRDPVTGEIAQLPGTAGCASQTGSDGACADVRALGTAADVAVSGDGTNVYVTAMGSDAVSVFSRDTATGALTQLAGAAGCVSETGTNGSCTDGIALDRARGIAISPDDANVYVGSEIGDAVSVFRRDRTGRLTQLGGGTGCISESSTGGSCADGTALDGVRSVVVSPDGATLYAASFWSSAVSVFARDAATGALTQLGAPAPPPPPPPPPPPETPELWLSLNAAATVGGVTAANEDVLAYDGPSGFAFAFDGSDVGLSAARIDAFSWLDPDSLLLSFDAVGTVPGIVEPVDDSDVVRFDASSLGSVTAGDFQMYLDGSDVGLTADAHDIDAVERLPDGTLLLSTTGRTSIAGTVGLDEDLLAFTPSSTGPHTSGTFALRFDGTDVGLGGSSEDVDAAAVDPNGKIVLSTTGAFAVADLAGADEDVFGFSPTALDPPTTAGAFAPTLPFDGSAFGLAANDVTGIDVP